MSFPDWNADAPVGMEKNESNEGIVAPSIPYGKLDDCSHEIEWYSRGYLPHRDRHGLLQSLTFRLADSLPQSKLKQLEQDLQCSAEIRRDIEKRKRIEQWLDAGMGCCALGHPLAADCVQNALLHFDGQRYRLISWVIMPNHIHVLVDPAEPISKTIQAWKSVTARWLSKHNEQLGLGIPNPKHVWMREYWDRFIRDEKHLQSTIDYIHSNPVKAGLCREMEDWPWSSAGRKNEQIINS